MTGETPPGPGWWLASDGKWYPPEAQPGGWWSAADQRWYPTQSRPSGPSDTLTPELRLQRRYRWFQALAWIATFSAFFQAQNGDPDFLVSGIYGLAFGVGLALAAVILGVRLIRRSHGGAGRLLTVGLVGLLTVLLLVVFVTVMLNGTWGGIEVETADIAWWWGLASVGGVAMGLLLARDPSVAEPRRDRLAIAALVFGILAVVVPLVPALLALPFGLLSLRRARRDALPRSDMAVAGSILGAVGLLALVPWVAGSDEAPATREAVQSVGTGDCVEGDLEDGVLRVVSCRALHDGEVYAVVEQQTEPGVAFPGTATLTAAGQQTCAQSFSAYVGIDPDSSDLDSIVLTPTEAEWRAGSRRLVCVAWYSDGTSLVESVRGSQS